MPQGGLYEAVDNHPHTKYTKSLKDRMARLCGKITEVLCRRKAVACPLAETVQKVNEKVRGRMNYYGRKHEELFVGVRIMDASQKYT